VAGVDASTAFSVVDLLGVASGAASGALAARRYFEFDIAGVVGLAVAVGLGGGLLRDVLLQAGTPVALRNALYLPLVTFVAVGVAMIATEPGPRWQSPMRVLDALAVGFFAVAGAQRAAHVGDVTVPAVLLIGVIGATGGAVLRDVFTATTPEIFRRGELNAIAALLAAAVFLVADEAGLSETGALISGFVVGFAVRLAAIRWDIRAPAPRRRPRTRA